MNQLGCVGCVLWLSAAWSAVAAEPLLTLPQGIQAALADNPELKSARAQVAAATGRAVQARAWPNPELELSAEDIPSANVGLSQSQNMIGLTQTVPFPGKKWLEVRAATQHTTATEWEYRRRERDLVRDVKTAFYRALAAEQKLTVATELVTLSESLVAVTRQRVAAGDAGDPELLRAEVEAERARGEQSEIQRELAEIRQELAALLGRPDDPLPPLQGELRGSADRPELNAALLQQHPDARAAAANHERARLELSRARLDPFPDVTIGAAVGRDEANDESLMEFRVSLPLPIFDWSQGKRREARALADVARHDAEATGHRLARELGALDVKLRATEEQVRAYRERILPKAEEAARLVRAGFDAGKFGFLDLVDTQRTLAETRLAYWDKLLELNLALADLEALAGGKENQP